ARRGKLLDDAIDVFDEAIKPWWEAVKVAADQQLASSIYGLGEARAIVRRLDPWRHSPPPIHESRIFQDGAGAYIDKSYDYPRAARVPDTVDRVLSTVERAKRSA